MLRESVLHMTVVLAAWLMITAEALSVFGLFSFWPVLVVWLIGLLGSSWWLKERLTPAGRSHGTFSSVDWLFGVVLIFLASTSLLSGLLTLPNAWDSLYYHLPRQVRWIQQGTLEHFPTHILAQLYREPLAEILSAQLFLLTGSDRVLTLVSFIGACASIVAMTLIARELGGGHVARLWAGFLGATVPLVYLHSLSTKNDLVLTFFFLYLIWMILCIHRRRRATIMDATLLGLAFGLMFLSKGSAFLLSLPLLLFLFTGLWNARLITCGRILIPFVLLPILLNAGHWSRNYRLFGTPLVPVSLQTRHLNETWEPKAIISRVLKEATLQMGTPSSKLNELVGGVVVKAHKWLGVDINDRRTTVEGQSFSVHFYPANLFRASAPVHLLIFVLGLFFLVFSRRFRRDRRILWLLGISATSFLLFCVVGKWDIDLNRRLHLPILLAACSLVSVIWGRSALRKLIAPFCVLLLLALVPTVRGHAKSLFMARPEVQGEAAAMLHWADPALTRPFAEVAAIISEEKPRVVGLITEKALYEFEYPMMRLLRETLYEPHFESVNVTNPSRNLYRSYRVPELLVSYSAVGKLIDEQTGIEYLEIFRAGPMTVLRPSGEKKVDAAEGSSVDEPGC